MRRIIFLVAAAVLVFFGAWCGKQALQSTAREETNSTGTRRKGTPPVRRIVSVAPSITEWLFALGLGDRVVGRTRYCSFPPEAEKLPVVGGYLDLNVEAVLRLQPDLVVLLPEQDKAGRTLEAQGVKTLVLEQHDSLADIVSSLKVLGARTGAEARARELIAAFRRRINLVKNKVRGRPKVRVLLSFGHGRKRLGTVYAATDNCIHGEVLRLCGGENAVGGFLGPNAPLSAEGILRQNPAVIVDLLPASDKRPEAAVLRVWREVKEVEAVRCGRVYLIRGDWAFQPGPRFVRLAEALARILHPEVAWEEKRR